MSSKGADGIRVVETASRLFPSTETASGYPILLYVGILSVFTVMTWLPGHMSAAAEAPYYYEHAMIAYAALLLAAYIGFTTRIRDKTEGRPAGGPDDAVKTGVDLMESLMECALNAFYLALITLPFLAATSILTLMGSREIALALALVVVCLVTYRYISMRLARALNRYPLLLYVLQLTLFIVFLFLSLISYPPLSPLFALHSVTALSRLTLGTISFYHPLGPYLVAVSLHGAILGALIAMDFFSGLRRTPPDGT